MLLALGLAEPLVRRLPLTPAIVYLIVGFAGGALIGPGSIRLEAHAGVLVVLTELALLVSLFAVGLRLTVPRTWHAWRAALMLAGPGAVVATALTLGLAMWLLELPWPAALLLAAILSPTDPVLASEVQIRSDGDRDAVRLTLSAEGGLNDGSALPLVLLALGFIGLHPRHQEGWQADWWWRDLLWTMGGGALIGAAIGWALGRVVAARLAHGDVLLRDEMLTMGAVALAYGLALATATSAFVVVFVLAVMLLPPPGDAPPAQAGRALIERMHGFGARSERLVEAVAVMAIGVALHTIDIGAMQILFAVLLVIVVRPLSVMAVVRRTAMSVTQRRLVAWFGIRGIGSLYYLALALDRGARGALADDLVAATLVAIAVSILLHGVSATPLMAAYQTRRGPR